ncbi:MAG TPA: nitroreductase family protein, partial [Nevskiaceae bacterium]|nr:nitroreductase family protein [Nevskiaceae bacterium]
APSHMNSQPWSFVIVTRPEAVARLGRPATVALRWEMNEGTTRYEARDAVFGPEFDVFYGAPALIVVCATQPGSLAEMDCAMAAYNIMLAASSMGLGSCWVSHAMPWLARPDGRAALGLSDDVRPVAPVVVGGPAGAPLSPGRYAPQVRVIKE